jgi:hypothetical protein
MLGWRLCYHTLRSKGSQSGFPDRVLVRERVIFAELKREKGKPTDSQIEWLDQLAFAGAEVYLWRPSDLEEIGQILATRHRLQPYPFSGLSPRYGSAWMKGKRSDEQDDLAMPT